MFRTLTHTGSFRPPRTDPSGASFYTFANLAALQRRTSTLILVPNGCKIGKLGGEKQVIAGKGLHARRHARIAGSGERQSTRINSENETRKAFAILHPF